MIGFLRNLFAAPPAAPAPEPVPVSGQEDAGVAAVKDSVPTVPVAAQPAPVRGPSVVMPRPRFGEPAPQGSSGLGMQHGEGARSAEPSPFWRPSVEGVPPSGGVAHPVVPVVPEPAFVASRHGGAKGTPGPEAEALKEPNSRPAEAVAAAQALAGILGTLVVEGRGIVLARAGVFVENAVLYPALAGALERARISAAAMGLGALDGFGLQAEGGDLHVLAAGRRLLCVLSRSGVELEAGALRRIADTLV